MIHDLYLKNLGGGILLFQEVHKKLPNTNFFSLPLTKLFPLKGIRKYYAGSATLNTYILFEMLDYSTPD